MIGENLSILLKMNYMQVNFEICRLQITKTKGNRLLAFGFCVKLSKLPTHFIY